MRRYRAFLNTALAVVAAIAATACLSQSSGKKELLNTSESKPQPGVSTAPDRKLSASVVVKLEEFGDYQCPPCGALHPSLKQLKQEFGPNLSFIFRNLPLTAIHKNAMAAAQAAEAARMQDHFWEMHDLLYENQNLWKEDINPRAIFLKFAADLGLDKARFIKDMDGEQVKLRIEADQSAAAESGIEGTPTVIIDGRPLKPEVTNAEGIRKGIEFMLDKKATATQ